MTGVTVVALLAVTGVVLGVRAAQGQSDPISRTLQQVTGARPAFPSIDTAALSPQRRAIIDTVRRLYAANPAGTTFSEGADQSWCADFVSTVMRDSGVPLVNPNSGSWRIPGVATLTDYLHDSGRWRSAQRTPQPGDIVLYDKPNHYGQHTNIVIARHGDDLVTVGGAEAQGVTLATANLATAVGIQGYGVPAA